MNPIFEYVFNFYRWHFQGGPSKPFIVRLSDSDEYRTTALADAVVHASENSRFVTDTPIVVFWEDGNYARYTLIVFVNGAEVYSIADEYRYVQALRYFVETKG